MLKKIVLGLIVLILIVGGFYFFISYQNKTNQIISPKKDDVTESIYGLGTVVSNAVYNVRIGVSLTVKKLYVSEGQKISKGQKLIQLDESTFSSPIDGVITKLPYKIGELVPAQVNVVSVTDLESLFLEVSLEQQSILQVKPGQAVLISFESLRSNKLKGLVTQVYPRENQFIVRVELKQWPVGVLPGMTADLAIVVGQKSQVLLIPLAAINAGKVLRLRQGKKEKIDVQVGVIDDTWAEVISDNIQIDDQLIIKAKE